jgi:hypothetical protein
VTTTLAPAPVPTTGPPKHKELHAEDRHRPGWTLCGLEIKGRSKRVVVTCAFCEAALNEGRRLGRFWNP